MNKRILCVFIVLVLAIAIIQEVDAKPSQRKMYRSIEDKINAEGSANVIVRLSTQAEYGVQKSARMNDKSFEVLGDSNILKKERKLKIINAYSGELTKSKLKDLKNLENQGYKVEIYEDRVFYLDATRSDKDNNDDTGVVEDINKDKETAESVKKDNNDNKIRTTVDTSVPSIGANYSQNVLNIMGRNITVAVIDSGIDYNHTDLGGCFGVGCRVKDGYDFIDNDNDPYDDNGHGTHVAGIIGANGTIIGVAPEVEFLAVKACDASGECNLSSIIEGIEWATNNGADIISMSIGGSYSDVIEGNTGKDSTSLAAEAAVNSGLIVVIAAGNNGAGISTIAVPGASENVITVGNVDDQGSLIQFDDIVASDSGRGPSAFGRLDPDIVAPGQLIYSTYPDEEYQTMSGTSMATPHVAGVAALMLEQNNALTPTEVRRILMQTSVNITGKVFDVGAGEVNAQNALTYNISAIVDARNSYSESVSNDRWEFISPISGTEYANITIYNDNDYPINFTLLLTEFQNMENSVRLNKTQFALPQNIVVPANDVYTIQTNFTVNNFSGIYATTYGGKLMFLGNDSKNLSVPIVVTIPITNYANLIRTVYESGSSPYVDPNNPGNGDAGDVLYYAYYNPKAGDEEIIVSWNGSSNDLDLYVYNSTADFVDNSGNAFTASEGLNTTNTDSMKWVRIHAYYFTTPTHNFTLNITDNGNVAPNITSVTNAAGIENYNFSVWQNITLNFYYDNTDNDSLTITFNDSRYTEDESYSGELTSNNITYTLATNLSLLGNHAVRLTIQDDYGAVTYRDITVRVHDVQITSFYPTNLTPVVIKNATINFTQTSIDPESNPLDYFWYVDGTLNSTSGNLTLNTTNMPNDYYNITFRVTNNITNNTQSWNLTIDQYGPTVSILSPNGTINNSFVRINITASDPSGLASCYYRINNSENNVTISNCLNSSTYLASGNYRIFVYSTDDLGFISQTNKTFNVSDSITPTISSASPDGDLDYESSVTLSIVANEYVNCKYDIDNLTYSSMDHDFTSTGTTNTREYNVDAETDYFLYVKCADLSNNVAGTELNFTIGAEPDSGGGGSSSSSNSGSTTTLPPVTPTTTNRYNRFIVEATDNITLNVNSENIALKYLYTKLLQTKRSVDMTIIQHNLDATPSAGAIFRTDLVKYAFIEVKHTNLGNDEIENTKLRIRLTKSWINDKSIDMNSIKIYRYSTSWDELSTRIYTQDSTSITYEAASPGLSYFIIAGKQVIQPVTPPPASNNEITGDQILVRKDVTQEKPLNIVEDAPEVKKSLFSPLIIIIVIAVIVTIVAADIVIVRKKNAIKMASKEEHIADLKKRYLYEGNQIIQEYNTRLQMLAKDPMRQQKAAMLKQQHDELIRELHSKYVSLINQTKESK